MGVKFRGAVEFIKVLHKYQDVGEVRRIVQYHGSRLQLKTMRRAPVDTGNLRAMVRLYSEDHGFTAHVISEAEYAAYQEHGTRNQSGKPHLRPSLVEVKADFIRDLNKIMK